MTVAMGKAVQAAEEGGPGGGIWHVRLRVGADGVEALGMERTDGELKAMPARSADFEAELQDSEGVALDRVGFADPRRRRIEYAEDAGAGPLRSRWIQGEEGEVTLRLRDWPAATRLVLHPAGPALAGRDSFAAWDLPGRGRSEPMRLASPNFAAAGAAVQRFVLLTNGPSARRLSIAILAEGYLGDQVARFTNDARRVLDRYLGTAPYSAFPRHVNALALFVASAESGSDHPTQGILRNTYFDTSYDSFGISYLVVISSAGMRRATDLLKAHVPDYDIAMMLVNDSAYGGSGGSILVSSVHESSAEIAMHELGHSFTGLGDEYEAPYPGYPDTEEPNTTRVTQRGQIKWNVWIEPSTPVPTPALSPHLGSVGLFEGAHYHAAGWYRPKFDCLMRSLGQPLCEVCREAVTRRIYEVIRPVDGVSPGTNGPVRVQSGESASFAVTALEPTGGLVYEWSLDGRRLGALDGPSIALDGGQLPSNPGLLKVIVRDPTPWVRTDPKQRLTDTIQWSVVREAGTLDFRVESASGGGLALSWLASAGDRRVEQSTRLAAPDWQPLNVVPGLAGDRRVVAVPAGGGERFFRLRRP